jgi:hypothetical protein
MNFYVGQKVVYVNDRQLGPYARMPKLPKLGSVYTIRAIVPCKARGYDEDGLWLVEIVNAPRLYESPTGPVVRELAFRVSRFRPLRTTNIDAFVKMLEPVKVREPA